MPLNIPPPPKVNDPRFDEWMTKFWKFLSPSRDSFTPGISFGGGTTGITYTTQAASYAKFMDMVFVGGVIVLSSKGSSTGAVRITGLPFTVKDSDTYGRSTAQLSLNGMTFTGQFQGNPIKNTTTISISQMTEAGTFSSLTDTNFTNTTNIIFSVFYRYA